MEDANFPGSGRSTAISFTEGIDLFEIPYIISLVNFVKKKVYDLDCCMQKL